MVEPEPRLQLGETVGNERAEARHDQVDIRQTPGAIDVEKHRVAGYDQECQQQDEGQGLPDYEDGRRFQDWIFTLRSTGFVGLNEAFVSAWSEARS